jgi:hypothetical protein
MKKRGPKRKVRHARRLLCHNRWDLILECGHAVERPVKSRLSWGHSHDGSIEDSAPGWVYCERCAE